MSVALIVCRCATYRRDAERERAAWCRGAVDVGRRRRVGAPTVVVDDGPAGAGRRGDVVGEPSSGAVVSTTVIVKVFSLALPAWSVAVQVTVVGPKPNSEALGGSQVTRRGPVDEVGGGGLELGSGTGRAVGLDRRGRSRP